MGHHFPAKSAEIIVLSSIFGLPGILRRIRRIRRIHYFPPETHPGQQNRPWVLHAGGQDDGSLNKLPQMMDKLLVPSIVDPPIKYYSCCEHAI